MSPNKSGAFTQTPPIYFPFPLRWPGCSFLTTAAEYIVAVEDLPPPNVPITGRRQLKTLQRPSAPIRPIELAELWIACGTAVHPRVCMNYVTERGLWLSTNLAARLAFATRHFV